jgi:hypothetical protein
MSNPTHIIFACDESGAKGFADNDERLPGEVGVFAGILMPQEYVAQRLPPFQAVVQKYARQDGKLHIAELNPTEKEALRNDMYEAIRKSELPCFWYAIHVAGLHSWYRRSEDVHSQARKARRSQVKMGSARSNPASLHNELFSGLYSHLIAFCEERKREELYVEIRLDPVDEPIVKMFSESANSLLNIDPKTKNVTGFDPITQKVVSGSVSSKISWPDDLRINVTVRSLELKVVDDSDGLVLAADVLANSLVHLFHNRGDGEKYRALNTREAVTLHPLAKQLDSFWNWGSGDLVGDRLYRHPKDPDGSAGAQA